MSEIITYQKALENYSDNDTKIYNAISENLKKLNVNPFVFGDKEFDLEGGNEEAVKEVHMTDGVLEIVTKSEGDLEEHEYQLTDDAISQLDKLEILRILESEVAIKEWQYTPGT